MHDLAEFDVWAGLLVHSAALVVEHRFQDLSLADPSWAVELLLSVGQTFVGRFLVGQFAVEGLTPSCIASAPDSSNFRVPAALRVGPEHRDVCVRRGSHRE